jgi:hypothetical protein
MELIMESMTIDQERKGRFLLDKKSLYCESVRRSAEVLSHAIKLTFQVDESLTKKLVGSLEEKVGRLDSALAELR